MSGQEHSIVFNIQKSILWYLICKVFDGKKIILSYLILIAVLLIKVYTIHGLKFVPALEDASHDGL